jgi:hypothetical protein
LRGVASDRGVDLSGGFANQAAMTFGAPHQCVAQEVIQSATAQVNTAYAALVLLPQLQRSKSRGLQARDRTTSCRHYRDTRKSSG